MGLSRKLGNASNQKSQLPEYFSVEYKWSTQSYTLQDIMDKFKLPCVVQCATDHCSISWSKFHFDFRYPLLLFSRRTVKKVHARSLTTSTQEEFGPSISIPEDYEGWFGAAPKGIDLTKRHTRIEGIANSNTLRFLVTTKCPAFTRSSGPNGFQEYVTRDIVPGEIFKRVCIMEGDLDDPDTPLIIQTSGPCLECLDEKDDDVIIPLSRRAISYEISEFYPETSHKVFNIKAMIDAGNSKLPRIISLVHGERPILDYAFTGSLRCYSVFTEETVLAATLDENSPLCLEMTTDSTAKFKLSLNETSIKRTCEYNNAFQLCKTSGDSFSTGLKVSFSVQPEPEVEENMSTYEMRSTMSDMQEVDAGSEFEIAWSSEQSTGSSKSNYKVKSIEKGIVSKIDDFILICNDSNQLPANKTEVKSETKKGRALPSVVSGEEHNPPDDFTEQEIADLMVRKGMLQRLGTSSSSSSDLNLSEEIETLRRTRVKVNPIYHCSEQDSEENKDECTDPEKIYSEIDDLNVDDENCDIVEVSLDESEFGEAVYTKASEYHGDTESEESELEFSVDVPNGAIEEDTVKKDKESNDELKVSTVEVEDEDEQEIPCHTSENSEITSEELEVQTVPLPESGGLSHETDNSKFVHGLNVTNKSSSSDMINKKKWWNSKKKGEGNPMLSKFKSESNISKIFDRLKGSDGGDSVSSSKTKLLLNPSVKSSSKSATRDETEDVEEDDNVEGIEC